LSASSSSLARPEATEAIDVSGEKMGEMYFLMTRRMSAAVTLCRRGWQERRGGERRGEEKRGGEERGQYRPSAKENEGSSTTHLAVGQVLATEAGRKPEEDVGE